MPCEDSSKCERACDCDPVAEPCTHESWEVTQQWNDRPGVLRQRRRCADCDEWLEDVLVDEPKEEPPEPEPSADDELTQLGQEIELPPQPERRPPYAVAYSVDGHGYEALLPGDASVIAEDGVLKISHPGLVAGIVYVKPVGTEEGDG